jgi:hypothetical protein
MRTLKADATVQTLSFFDDGPFLETDRGMLRTTSLPPGEGLSRRNLSSGIFVKEQWVTHGIEMCFGFLSSIDRVGRLQAGFRLRR